MSTIVDRSQMISKRKSLPIEVRQNCSDIISNKLFLLDEYKNAKDILIYADSAGEVATDKIIMQSLINNKRVFAPVSHDDCSMEFYRIFSIDEMYPGYKGIREPLEIDNLIFDTGSSDKNDTCVIVPGVCFDKNKNRAGFGKGFYDRYLARIKSTNIAIAYDFQVTDSIDTCETDIPMDIIITEKEIYV